MIDKYCFLLFVSKSRRGYFSSWFRLGRCRFCVQGFRDEIYGLEKGREKEQR